MLARKGLFRNSVTRKLDPEPPYSGTVSITAVPTHIAVANNDIQVSVDTNLRLGKKVFVSLTGLSTDYANLSAEATVDAQGNANISVPVKLSTWANIDSTAISVSVTREGGSQIGSATGNVYSNAHGFTMPRSANTTNFDIGTGEARIEGIQNKFVNQFLDFGLPSGNAEIDYVIIGSGGAGGTRATGNDTAGAGGAGGFLEAYSVDLFDPYAGTSYDIDLRARPGNTNTNQNTPGKGDDAYFNFSGSNTVFPFDSVESNVAYAFGGGNGASATTSSQDGSDGGSGGGSFSTTAGSGGTGVSGQGFDGGRLINGWGGGGGGASEVGNPVVSYERNYGGNGKYSEITGANVAYAGGGYGKSAPASRVDFGGGMNLGDDGTDFKGGGGAAGGDGGAGTVIIRQHGDYTTNIILD